MKRLTNRVHLLREKLRRAERDKEDTLAQRQKNGRPVEGCRGGIGPGTPGQKNIAIITRFVSVPDIQGPMPARFGHALQMTSSQLEGTRRQSAAPP